VAFAFKKKKVIERELFVFTLDLISRIASLYCTMLETIIFFLAIGLSHYNLIQ